VILAVTVRRIALAGLVMVAVTAVLVAGTSGNGARAAAGGPAVRVSPPPGRVGARTPAVQRPGRVAPAPSVTVPSVSGSACYVSIPECSQTPCVELIGAASATAVYTTPAAGVQRARPLSGCGRARTGPGLVTAVPRPPSSALRRLNPYGAALKSLAHRLQRSFPGAP